MNCWPRDSEVFSQDILSDSLSIQSPEFQHIRFMELVRAPIARLHRRAGPAAILWRIVAVGIDPINRPARWSRRHIGDEVSNVVPTPAYSDAPSTVARVRRNVGVVAALHHRKPRSVARMFMESVLGGVGPYSKWIACTSPSQIVCSTPATFLHWSNTPVNFTTPNFLHSLSLPHQRGSVP